MKRHPVIVLTSVTMTTLIRDQGYLICDRQGGALPRLSPESSGTGLLILISGHLGSVSSERSSGELDRLRSSIASSPPIAGLVRRATSRTVPYRNAT
jgi:hypothetical protein